MKAFKWKCVALNCLVVFIRLHGGGLVMLIEVISYSLRGQWCFESTRSGWSTRSPPCTRPLALRGKGAGDGTTGSEEPPELRNVTPVISAPASCHHGSVFQFIFLIDTVLYHSVSVPFPSSSTCPAFVLSSADSLSFFVILFGESLHKTSPSVRCLVHSGRWTDFS